MREHSWHSDRRKTAERWRHFAFVLNQAASALRSVLLIVSVMTALTTIAGKRDLAGFIVYVQSSGFLQTLSIVVSIVTFVWGQWTIRHRAKQRAAVSANPRAPEAVAALKGTVA